MKSVVVMASRCVERRRRNERETRLDADLPIRVVALSNNSSSFELLELDEARVILLITSCFCKGKLVRN